MKITIFGTGYVGLVTGTCFAEAGNNVVCVDIDEEKINALKNGKIPIYEPGLEELVHKNSKEGRLQFTNNPEEGVAHGEIQFIAVGTPPDEDGSADLQYVLSVAKTIGEHMNDQKVIVNKSTVPVGTADKVNKTISDSLKVRGKEVDYSIVSNPEFLKEGAAINDFMKPDRIVVGVEHDHASETMKKLYAPFNRNYDRLQIMDIRSAELAKYASNAMLATKISFMNELSNIADRLGADIEAVRHAMGSDTRIGHHFIYPGCGYGGSCFPKDVQALFTTAKNANYDAKILGAVEDVNSRQKDVLFEKISEHFGEDISGKTFAVWGLSFKPNTDDMRDAPSRRLIEALWDAGAIVQAYDPVAMNEAKRIYGDRTDFVLFEDQEDALKEADALVIITEWQNFRSPDFDKIKNELKQPLIFDGRNVYNPEDMKNQGFSYYSIGRRPVII
ncbi:UDP-glucose dehydrogenase family protein [Patescibacteria group bacterium]